jgi:hypothetical protein
MNKQQRRADTFLRGLLTGAVVGAVIAGSTLWERRRRKAGATDAVTEDIAGNPPRPAPADEPQGAVPAAGARGPRF